MADIERKEQEVPKYVKVREVMQLCEVSESRAYYQQAQRLHY